MKIIFKQIQIHNFMSFADEIFNFDQTNGMVLIRGRNHDIPNETNGAGKSTIGYSLLYTLFGQLQTKIKNENIINRAATDRDMRLVLNFQVDSNNYRIERGIQKGRTSYLNLYSIGDSEINMTKSTIQETQKYLESEILRCDLSIFLRTIMLTADQTYNFYLLKKQDKKDFVEKLFDIGVFGEMYSQIHKDVLQLDRSALAKQNRLMVLNQNISDYTARAEKFDAEKNENILSLNRKIEQLKTEKNDLMSKEVVVNVEAVEKLRQAIQKLQEAELKCEKRAVDIRGLLSKNDLKSKEADMIRKSNQAQIDKHSEILKQLCGDCAEKFGKYYNLDKCQKEIENSLLIVESAKNEKDLIIQKRDENTKRKNECSQKIDLVRNKIEQMTAEQNKLKQKIQATDRDLQRYELDLANELKKNNPYIDLIDSCKSSIKTETSSIDELTGKINYLKFAEDIVSQDTLRKFIIKDLIGILNNKIRKYLTQLGANYYVQFDDDMDYEFVPTIGTCEFGNFSAGERMRLMIATSFAFRDFMSIRNGLYSNILILDEYFDGAISSACIENLMKILKDYMHESNQNIFIISQRQEVQLDNFDRIVQVEKRNGISSIKYQ